MNLAAHGGTIYRVGGMSPRNAPGEKSDNVSLIVSEKFDPKVGKWQPLPDIPAGRSSHDLVVVGDKLVVVGGWQMNGKDGKTKWHDTALSLDLARPEAKWESIPQPFQRRALTASVLGGIVYVIGGLTAESKSVRKLDILDVATGKWSTGPDFPGDDRVGFSPAATVVGERIILSTSDNGAYRLLADGSAWENVATAGSKRLVHRALPLGKNSVLLVGGAGGKDGNHADLEVLKLAVKGEKVSTLP
jgi:N-acetylneuraminic acid mutarotase